MYIEALKNSRFKEEFTYGEPKMPNNNNNNNNNDNNNNNKSDMNKENTNFNKVSCHKNRQRKIIWFNPALSKLVNINIGK